MKRILILSALTVAMLLGLVACGSDEGFSNHDVETKQEADNSVRKFQLGHTYMKKGSPTKLICALYGNGETIDFDNMREGYSINYEEYYEHMKEQDNDLGDYLYAKAVIEGRIEPGEGKLKLNDVIEFYNESESVEEFTKKIKEVQKFPDYKGGEKYIKLCEAKESYEQYFICEYYNGNEDLNVYFSIIIEDGRLYFLTKGVIGDKFIVEETAYEDANVDFFNRHRKAVYECRYNTFGYVSPEMSYGDDIFEIDPATGKICGNE